MRGKLNDLPDEGKRKLHRQIQGVSEQIGADILPPEIHPEVMGAEIEEIRTRFRFRLQTFLKFLGSSQKGGEVPAEAQKYGRRIEALNNLLRYFQKENANEEERTLMLQQIDVFETLMDFLEAGHDAGYIKLPTGYGKTVIFTEFIEALGLRSLIVVPTKDLVEQTEEKLQQFAEDLDVGKIYSDAKEHGQHVTITTYASFVSGVRSGSINPEDFDCLILDEVHRGLSQARMDTINRFPHAIRIGFSATPDFSEQKRAALVLDRMIYEKKLIEAIEEGQLCSVRSVFAKTNVDLSNVQLSSNGDYKEADLEKAVNIESRNKSAIDLYQTLFAGQRAVAYCVGVNHARTLAEKFREAGVRAQAVWGDMDKNERREILAAAKRGEIDVLCNADLLIEGYDDPGASVCFNLRPTKSRVNAEQRGGRVLRVDRQNLDKMAYVIDFIDSGTEKEGIITFPDVLFTDVLGRAEVLSPSRKNPPGPPPDQISIEGLEVITDQTMVAELLRERQIARSDENAPKISTEEINELVRQGWKMVDKPWSFGFTRKRWREYVERELASGSKEFVVVTPEITMVSPESCAKLEGQRSTGTGWPSLEPIFNRNEIDIHNFVLENGRDFIDYRIPYKHNELRINPDFLLNRLKEIEQYADCTVMEAEDLVPLPEACSEKVVWRNVPWVITITGKDGKERHLLFVKNGTKTSEIRLHEVRKKILARAGYVEIEKISQDPRVTREWEVIKANDPHAVITITGTNGLPVHFWSRETRDRMRKIEEAITAVQKKVLIRKDLQLPATADTLDPLVVSRIMERLQAESPEYFDIREDANLITKTISDRGKDEIVAEINRITQLPLGSGLFTAAGFERKDFMKLLSLAKRKWPQLVHYKSDFSDAHVEEGFEKEFTDALAPAEWIPLRKVLELEGVKDDKEAEKILRVLMDEQPGEHGVRIERASVEESHHMSPALRDAFLAQVHAAREKVESERSKNSAGLEFVQQTLGIDERSAISVLKHMAIKDPQKVSVAAGPDGKEEWRIDKTFFMNELTRIEAPEDWQTIAEVVSEFGSSLPAVKKALAAVPGWQNMTKEFYEPKSGSKKVYLPPSLIESIAGSL